MSNLIRLTLLATLVLGVGMLALGSFGASPPAPKGHSPYLSALSDLSVPPAEAVPCNNKLCEFIDNPGHHNDHWECTTEEILTHCLIQGSNCTQITPCPQ